MTSVASEAALKLTSRVHRAVDAGFAGKSAPPNFPIGVRTPSQINASNAIFLLFCLKITRFTGSLKIYVTKYEV